MPGEEKKKNLYKPYSQTPALLPDLNIQMQFRILPGNGQPYIPIELVQRCEPPKRYPVVTYQALSLMLLAN